MVSRPLITDPQIYMPDFSKCIVTRKGYIERSSEFMTNCWRPSPQHVHETHWQKFVKYCKRKHWNALDVRSQHYYRYAMHMIGQGYQPGMIIAHRTSIYSVPKHWKYNSSTDHETRMPHLKFSAGSSYQETSDATIGPVCCSVHSPQTTFCEWGPSTNCWWCRSLKVFLLPLSQQGVNQTCTFWDRSTTLLFHERCGTWLICGTLRWRHNDHAGVSHHQPHGCLLNRLFRRRSKKTSKLRVTGLCAGNSPGTGEFPAQMASYAENVSIWWRHHEIYYQNRGFSQKPA